MRKLAKAKKRLPMAFFYFILGCPEQGITFSQTNDAVNFEPF
jgi:hypothetical protein